MILSIVEQQPIMDLIPSNVIDIKQSPNSFSKVKFREDVLTVEQEFLNKINNGVVEDALKDCLLTHHFSPVDEKYGCGTYAREMFIPKDTLVIGKIHRHQHLNFIMRGKVSVATEFGKKYFVAPCIFVSEIGLKRAVYAEEDTIWVTIHLTKNANEESLAKIEEEVISPSYDEIGLLDSTSILSKLENKGEEL
jgi:hypothetical protein